MAAAAIKLPEPDPDQTASESRFELKTVPYNMPPPRPRPRRRNNGGGPPPLPHHPSAMRRKAEAFQEKKRRKYLTYKSNFDLLYLICRFYFKLKKTVEDANHIAMSLTGGYTKKNDKENMTITTELLHIKKKLFFVPSRAMTRGPRPTTSAQHQRCSPSRQSSFTRHDIFSQLVHLSWVSSCEASLNLTFSLTYISPSVGLLVWSASIGLFDLSSPATITLLILAVWFIQS